MGSLDPMDRQEQFCAAPEHPRKRPQRPALGDIAACRRGCATDHSRNLATTRAWKWDERKSKRTRGIPCPQREGRVILVAKQTERTKISNVTLPRAYQALGKDIHGAETTAMTFPLCMNESTGSSHRLPPCSPIPPMNRRNRRICGARQSRWQEAHGHDPGQGHRPENESCLCRTW